MGIILEDKVKVVLHNSYYVSDTIEIDLTKAKDILSKYN